MPSVTPNYGWFLPLVDDPTDEDLWGDYLNDNLSDQDTLLKTFSDNFQGAEANVAAATTTDIGAASSVAVNVTGSSVTITGLGTVAAGTTRKVRFAGINTLTHNGTSLILPGAANITTAANDEFEAISLGSGNWLLRYYTKANGQAVVQPASVGRLLNIQYITSTSTYTKTVGTTAQKVKLWGGGGGGGASGVTGGNSVFDVMTANGGAGSSATVGGLGGTASGGSTNMTGGAGGNIDGSAFGGGGGSAAGGGGGGGLAATAGGSAGGFPGGGGGTSGASTGTGGGGGYSEKYYTSSVTGVSVTIGAAGTAGSSGHAGAAGLCIVEEYS